MLYLVIVETVVLVLLAVLVGGLLRSHAEILRRLDAAAGIDPHADHVGHTAPDGSPMASGVSRPRVNRTPAADLAGTTPSGDARQIALPGPSSGTLLAFLSTGCEACGEIWSELRAADAATTPGGARLVAVTKDPDRESPTKVGELAPAALEVLMSSKAWADYGVPSSPYFIYVDGDGQIHSEGSARSMGQAYSLMADAIADAGHDHGGAAIHDEIELVPAGARAARGGIPAQQETKREQYKGEHAFRKAGIGPGHPSLYEP